MAVEPVIAGHPLHPIMITVPVGSLTASYLLDLAATFTGNDDLKDAAYYSMLVGVAGTVPSAITGLMDFSQMKQNDPAHKMTLTHAIINSGVVSLYVVNILARSANRKSKFGFLLSTVGALGLAVSGYLGGEIAYGRGWRVRNAERFELEWQKRRGVGPFAPDGAEFATEQEYPPETLKGFHEKKSGEAVFEEIKNS
jgi:uncharacterized membrane protein